MTSPARISTFGPPSHRVQPTPLVTISVWTERVGVPCGARAGFEGHDRTARATRFVGRERRVDPHLPVNHAAGPVAEGWLPLRMIFIETSLGR